MTDTLKKVDDKISHKEFFMGSWYKSGIRDLCTDGWPAFVVPVNMRINKMLNDLDELQTELAQLKEKCEQWEKAYLEKQDQFVNETKRASDLYEKCAEYEKVLKSIDTDTEIDDQGREWRMDKDDMRIISRNVLEKYRNEKV